jgi:AcrR family transcriptional regulator
LTRPVKRRGYDSPVRQEQAAQTRTRIVDAAGHLFEAKGYARTTVRQIAEAAGVAVDTVYATFGSKPRVLTALIDARLSAGTGVANVMERPEAQAVRDETDPRRQITLLAHDLAQVVTRVGPVFEMMRTAASVEPAMAKVYAEMQGYRFQNMRTAIGWIAARGPLRVSEEQAAETLWVLAAPDTARLLMAGRGWTTDQYAEWLAGLLSSALLGADDPERP